MSTPELHAVIIRAEAVRGRRALRQSKCDLSIRVGRAVVASVDRAIEGINRQVRIRLNRLALYIYSHGQGHCHARAFAARQGAVVCLSTPELRAVQIGAEAALNII